MKRFICGLVFFISTFASAHNWPGTGGMICVDTPEPSRYSPMDYKMAADGGPIVGTKSPEERVAQLKKQPVQFEGDLTIQVNDGPPVDLPRGRGAFIDGLDPLKKHKIKISNKAGKGYAAFSFKFDDPKDPRTKLAQGTYYHNDMQFDPPPKKCKWANEKSN